MIKNYQTIHYLLSECITVYCDKCEFIHYGKSYGITDNLIKKYYNEIDFSLHDKYTNLIKYIFSKLEDCKELDYMEIKEFYFDKELDYLEPYLYMESTKEEI